MAAVAAWVTLALGNAAYTNIVHQQTSGALCAFLTASLPGATPPATERGREIERRYLKLIRDLDC